MYRKQAFPRAIASLTKTMTIYVALLWIEHLGLDIDVEKYTTSKRVFLSLINRAE